ncbi:hypothetical protein CAPTEDRAFT_183767 [Capitella teleta]|uniref:Zinc/iron permease n=1 Tax=Capitella teleta TaxID=283909 RepID=R7TST2_CAPTE|nr:hypothetical protein CAPTEDRAFT_183767 [Capitella teleta]|eukprot:ELT96667.1 hypothetical protein CAPTEDRAFT_183767 [Capitella teleta]
MAPDTQTTKIIVLCTLLISTFFFSMLPIKLFSVTLHELDRERRRRYKSVISLLSCFAAGVFLATCLLDLFPDVQSNLNAALVSMNVRVAYPLAEFILMCGMFFILIAEQFVLTLKDTQRDGERQPLLSDEPRNGLQWQVSTDTDVSQSYAESEIEEEETEERTEAYQDPSSHSIIRSLILLLALSLHSLFEGLAVGLQPTKKSVLEIFAALALHKSILAFSLGLNLVQSKMALKNIMKSNLLFSVTSPIGIAIGIVIIRFSPDQTVANLVDGVLEGMACGTFLFVVFFEILPHEFMTKKRYPNRMLKVLFLVLGYATVAGLLFLDPDNRPKRIFASDALPSQSPSFSFWG